jgi:DNA-directed DNA polymerase III PolC
MIPLTLRSHYSLMWGTAPVMQLCQYAKQLGYEKIALTDTNNLYGMWSFISACKALGMTPIIGAEITDPNRSHRAICLVKNGEGYQNLTRLLTRRHRDKQFVLRECLADFGKGLVILTQSPDLLAFWHEQGLDLGAALPRNPLSQTHPLCRIARKLGIPLAATPGNFFLTPGGGQRHALLRAIDKNTCLSRLGPGDMAPATAFLASPGHYRKRFCLLPEAIENTRMLAEKLTFQGPDFGTVMPKFLGKTDRQASVLLREKTFAGAISRYGLSLPGRVISRIEYELSIIAQKKFCGYFLVVQQIVQQATRICGRGSAAASIVAYCLGITNVCPVKYNLYFERFLNPGRIDPPDIDVDFAWDERDGILNWVLSEFKGHAAMVSSHILFQPRMAVREVAKVYGLPESEIKSVSSRLPLFWKQAEPNPADSPTRGPADSLLEQIREKPEFRCVDFPQPWPEIMTRAQAIIGTPRYLSVHPGGIVITPDPIDTYVPVETAPRGIPLIQWEKEGAEAAGLVKIDLLGNRSLGVIRDCINTIESATGGFTGFSGRDPEDDPDTRQQVARGNTMGCFYIESPAMRLLQKKSKLGDFSHVVIHSSIIRPAANEFIADYLKRLHTGEWEPLHPILEGVLEETLGIMVFQEDVSRVAVHLAGFSHVQADGLRKIMSKKDKSRQLADYYARFGEGAALKGVAKADIQKIWEMILSFSGYSFCKPHSASYARVSFQAAYLKTHYPAQFMAAVISNQGGFYSTFAYVSEARRMGVKLVGPDILESQIKWTGNACGLRVGFMAVKHLKAATMVRIVAERNRSIFTGFDDFLNRVRPREDEVLSLVHSGCLDRFTKNKTRSGLLWAFAAWQKERNRQKDAPTLFGRAQNPIPTLPPDHPRELLRREFSVLGFLCGGHPISLFSSAIQRENTLKAMDLPRYIGKKVGFAGWLITGKTVNTKQGDPMKFLTFEDETGIVETVFFPGVYARFCHCLDYGKPYFLFGKIESDWGAITLTVETTRQIQQ